MTRKHREDFHDDFSYEMYLDKIINDLIEALILFAESPDKCGRGSIAYSAYKAIKQVEESFYGNEIQR
jgi:hypothetical protein